MGNMGNEDSRDCLRCGRSPTGKRGSALIIALLAVTVLVGMVAVVMQISVSSKKQIESARQDTRAFYLAEAGLTEALAAFEATVPSRRALPTNVGTHEAPRTLNGGTFWVEIEGNGDGTWTVTSHGEANGSVRSLVAVVDTLATPVFDNALFAGNSSGDPLYALTLGGLGVQGDEVTGDMYSGGDTALNNDTTVEGTVRALGSISGIHKGKGGKVKEKKDPKDKKDKKDKGDAGGVDEEGVLQPIPDLVGMDYAHHNDYDVKKEFATGGATYKANALGGSAWQLPESNPAHFFRKNPSDRTADTSKTPQDDYFMEDPYEPLKQDLASTGADACPITLSGTAKEPGPDGNKKIYYIDGNLWLHNPNTMSFKLFGDAATGAQVTFVVKGNIYFSDNLFYQNSSKDAVLFISLKDAAVKDSGNIYFGDPAFGTLEQMHAFMYAENDFVDYNLNAAGSAKVRVLGNMSAGNHVRINRDYKVGKSVQHSKLTVDLDTRILDGSLDLPGMPSSGGGVASGYEVVSWRDMSVE